MEFVLVMPLFLILYFGVIEITMMVADNRNVARAANLMGDLVTQQQNISAETINDVFSIGVLLLNLPSSEHSNLSIVINSYRLNPDDVQIEQIGTASLGSAVSTPLNITTEDILGELNIDSVDNLPDIGLIVAHVEYRRTPIFLGSFQTSTLRETLRFRPRQLASISFGEDANPLGQIGGCVINAQNLVTGCQDIASP